MVQLHPYITQLFHLLFADDMILFSTSVIGLQRQINELEHYCKNTELTVNTEKTKIVVFKIDMKWTSTITVRSTTVNDNILF